MKMYNDYNHFKDAYLREQARKSIQEHEDWYNAPNITLEESWLKLLSAMRSYRNLIEFAYMNNYLSETDDYVNRKKELQEYSNYILNLSSEIKGNLLPEGDMYRIISYKNEILQVYEKCKKIHDQEVIDDNNPYITKEIKDTFIFIEQVIQDLKTKLDET